MAGTYEEGGELHALEDLLGADDPSKAGDSARFHNEELEGSLKTHAIVTRDGKSSTFDVAFHGGLLYLTTADTDEPELIFIDPSVVTSAAGKALDIQTSDNKLKLEFSSEEECHGWAQVVNSVKSAPELTEEHKKALEDMKAKLPAEVGFEYTERDMLRFLKGNEWNVDEAVRLFVEYGFFRKQFQVDKIRISEVLPDFDIGKFAVPGNRDRLGRPVVVMVGRSHWPRETNFLNTVKSMLYSLERAIEMCGDRDDLCVVVDLKDIGRKNVDERLERMCTEMMKMRYPGRFGSFITINTPWWFGALWRLVRPWLSAEMREIAHVLRGGAERLKPFFTEDQILEEWGGSFNYDRDDWIAERFETEGIDPGDASLIPIENDFLMTLSSIPARDAATEAVKTGYMTKLGAVVKNWKKRFFILTDSALFYYTDPKADSPKGAIYLERSVTADINNETDKKFSFLLVTPLRTYVFVCKDEADMTEWRSVLDETCAALALAREL